MRSRSRLHPATERCPFVEPGGRAGFGKLAKARHEPARIGSFTAAFAWLKADNTVRVSRVRACEPIHPESPVSCRRREHGRAHARARLVAVAARGAGELAAFAAYGRRSAAALALPDV